MKNDKKRAPKIALLETQNGFESDPHNTHYIIKTDDCQDIISKPKKELERLTPKRELTGALSKSYQRLDLWRNAEAVAHCGDHLQFIVPIENGQLGESKLNMANFCKDRLCPVCTYRKTLKIFNQLSAIMDVIENDYSFLMLTLTIPNCHGWELSNTIDELMKGVDRLFKRTRVKKAVKGYFRALEVTRNEEVNTYHPHYHFILAVNNSYFTSRDYIHQAEWLKLWQEAMKDDSITQLDIRRIKPTQAKNEGSKSHHNIYSKAVAEVGKYTVKSEDYIFVSDPHLMDTIVMILHKALHHRRLVHLSGIFKKVAKDLKINIDDEILTDEISTPLANILVIDYNWTVGVGYKASSIQHLITNLDNGSIYYNKYSIKDKSGT